MVSGQSLLRLGEGDCQKEKTTTGTATCLLACDIAHNFMVYYVRLNDRPLSIPAEGRNRRTCGHWEKKREAYLPAASPMETGLCQVLSAMAATTTCLVSFSASTFVPCSPFGPDLQFKLREVLLLTVCTQQGADPGRSPLLRSLRLLHSFTSPTANGEQKPPAAPAGVTNSDQFMHSSPQSLSSSFSAQSRMSLLCSGKLANTSLPISQLTARWVRIRQACAASDCDTRDKTPSGINNFTDLHPGSIHNCWETEKKLCDDNMPPKQCITVALSKPAISRALYLAVMLILWKIRTSYSRTSWTFWITTLQQYSPDRDTHRRLRWKPYFIRCTPLKSCTEHNSQIGKPRQYCSAPRCNSSSQESPGAWY